jgi:hypothetical protein
VWSYYEVYDNYSIPGVRNFSYLFNVAATVMETPSYALCSDGTARGAAGLPVGYCPEIAFNSTKDKYVCTRALVPILNDTAAYQLAHHSDVSKCYRLHDGESAAKWTMLDEVGKDPAQGVVLTYDNGDWCPSGGINRRLRLVFECADNANNYFDREEEVVEDPTCEYTIRLKTVHACPIGCYTTNEHLCNKQGLCEWDFTNQAGHCFCYDGYYGKDCTDTEDPYRKTTYSDDDTGYISALVIVILLLVVAGAILVYLFLKFKKLTDNPSNAFRKLEGAEKQRGGSRMLLTDDDEPRMVPL